MSTGEFSYDYHRKFDGETKGHTEDKTAASNQNEGRVSIF